MRWSFFVIYPLQSFLFYICSGTNKIIQLFFSTANRLFSCLQWICPPPRLHIPFVLHNPTPHTWHLPKYKPAVKQTHKKAQPLALSSKGCAFNMHVLSTNIPDLIYNGKEPSGGHYASWCLPARSLYSSSLQITTCQEPVSFKVLVYCLVDHILGKVVVAVGVGLKVVSYELLVEGRLIVTGFIALYRPET